MDKEPIRIFISYSHENEIWLTEYLNSHDKNPKYLLGFWERSLRGKNVEFWYDREEKEGIRPADKWEEKIFENIDKADIAILLITQDFVISPYIRDIELPRIINRSQEGKLEILPILLEPARLKDLAIANTFQITPGRPTPLCEYLERSENDWKKVRLEVIEAIENVIDRVVKRNYSPGPAGPPERKPESIPNPINGYFFVVEETDPYYLRYRDQDVPIVFQQFKSQNSKANIWFAQAEKFFYNLKIEEAIRFYKKSIEEDSSYIESYLKLALISWLFQRNDSINDAINYCQTGYDLNNSHTIGSFLIYLNISNNRIEAATSLLHDLVNGNKIENKKQLAGLYFLQSKLNSLIKDYGRELENAMLSHQTSPFFGPAIRQLGKIYIAQNEFDKAEALLKNAFGEYSKYCYCRNWLDTREALIQLYSQRGMNEMCIQLLTENHAIQDLLNAKKDISTTKSNIFFEGEIEGKISKGYLVNGNGFNFTRAILQDGLDTSKIGYYEFEVDNSPDFCMFFDLRFGGTIVKIESISYLVKIVHDNNTGCLIQINNGFKLSGNKDAFPNLWLVSEDASIKPISLSMSSSLNLRRI